MRDTSGALLQAASGSHSSRSGLLISIRSQRLPRACTHGPAEAAFLDASLLLPAGRVHPVRMELGACSLQAHQPSRVGRQRPPGASKSRASTRTRVYDPNMPDVARTFCAQSKTIPIRDQCQLEVGWARVARAVSLAPTTTLHFSRSNARGRSDLHSPNDAWTSLTHGRPGIRQARRGMKTASSPFRQNGDSRLAATGSSGFREQIDGSGWSRASLCINTRDLRDGARVPWAG